MHLQPNLCNQNIMPFESDCYQQTGTWKLGMFCRWASVPAPALPVVDLVSKRHIEVKAWGGNQGFVKGSCIGISTVAKQAVLQPQLGHAGPSHRHCFSC
jgi:hypothetical protein